MKPYVDYGFFYVELKSDEFLYTSIGGNVFMRGAKV